MIFGHKYLRKSLLACAIISVSFAAFAAPPNQATASAKSAPLQVDHSAFDAEAHKAERQDYLQWLLSERVPSASRNPLVLQATSAEMDAVDTAPRQDPEIVGFSQAAGYDATFRNINLSGLRTGAKALKYGAMKGTADGGYVYTIELSSPGAFGLRVQFAGFNLPTGAAIFLYTTDGQVFGPYSRKGPLGTGSFESNALLGDSITLQLRQTGPTTQKTLRDTRFRIEGLGHIRPRLMSKTCSYNASCVENASCTSSSVVSAAEDAVALMLFRSGGYYYICSGGLINDFDTSNNLPLFLTANHCISRSREAESLENFFQFRTPCNSTSGCDWTLSNLPSTPRTTGATIVSTGRDQDYTLLRLAEAAPGGSAFLGWNSAAVHNSTQTLYRISHPGGAPQSYSTHVVDPSAPTCTSWPRGNRIYSRDVIGATEGGSSGSPVLNTSGQVVGQLSGACGTNVNDNCDADSNATVDGAFAAYFSQVEPFLDPDPGSCTPSTEVCDGEDNDCDGQVDEGCGGGLPTGAACTVNADCASNNCKGKPGAKTCK